MVGATYPVNTIFLPTDTTIDNPYVLTWEQFINAGQYEFATANNNNAFANSGTGLLISADAIKRYYVCYQPKETLNYKAQINAISATYGFSNLPITASDENSIYSVQIPRYFNMLASYALGRGTEICFMEQNEDGTFVPTLLFRNILDFIGFDGVMGFPGPASSAYVDQKGEAPVARFTKMNRANGIYWF